MIASPTLNRPGPTPQWAPPEKSEAVSKLFEDLIGRVRSQRAVFEREWFQEVLFYAGYHWIIFDRARGQWRYKRGPKWFPRPVTNRTAEHVDDNVSALTRKPPELSWLPVDDDPKSIAAADVADRIDQIIIEETGRFRNAREKASWAVVTGDVFVESGYDKSSDNGTVSIQHEECMDCGFVGHPMAFADANNTCPGCGAADDSIIKAFERTAMACPNCGQFPYDEQLVNQPCPLCTQAQQQAALAAAAAPLPNPGELAIEPALPLAQDVPILKAVYGDTPIRTTEPKGKLWERVRSPFEVFYDFRTVREFSPEGGLEWCIIREMVSDSYAKRQYPGLKLTTDSAVEGQGASLSLRYLDTLAGLASIVDPATSNLLPGPHDSSEDRRCLREVLYHVPTTEFPQGLIAVQFNGSIVAEVCELRYTDADGKPFIPVVHIPFKKQPGRVPGRTFMTDIISLNRLRNETEAMMVLCERRMANPVWLVPDGLLDRNPSGEPGEVVTYKHLSAGQGRPPIPTRAPGIEPGMYFDRRIQSLDAQMERLGGSFAIAHGEAPRGITAASALALLGERQERAVSPQIQSWEQAHERLARQQMHIFKEYATEQRIRPLKDSMSKWSFESWSKADLGGNITVKVEPGSAMPKSSAQLRAAVEVLMRIPGFLDLMDPEIKLRVHQILGTTTLIQHMDLDVKDAQQEQDLFLRKWTREPGAKPMVFRDRIDNHMVHVSQHIRFAKSDAYRDVEEAAAKGDPLAASLVAEFMHNLEAHMFALMPPPPPAEPGPGRPEGTGKVLSAGRQDVPATERAIVEPGSSVDEGLR
jgi:hypothetical protein